MELAVGSGKIAIFWQNEPSGANKSRFFIGNRKKPRFQPLGKAKSPNFCASNPLESQKHSISAFPTPWKAKNTQFLHFQPLGKTKSLNFCASNPLEKQKCPENRPSSGDEMQKTIKIVCRWPTKRKKRQKLSVVGRRNAKYSKNYSSSADETQNRPKTALHPRMTSEKQ